jgi:hypothetical protein
LIVIAVAVRIGWDAASDRLMRLAFMPRVAFAPLPESTAPDYAWPQAWLSRPDLGSDPARWVPDGVQATDRPQAAVFYIAPTTYLGRDHWNAPLTDADANARLKLFARSQASAFNGVAQIWAPRYRQATLGAFLANSDPRSAKAIDFAYRDVARAFDVFLKAIPADQPIILAGHSQGSLHLLRLLCEKVAGTPLARRIVAIYAVGWPISIEADLPALGFPACDAPDQARCILSWQSFADPADPRLIKAYFDASRGYDGRPRKGSHMLCVNPITGKGGGAAPSSANRGTLVPRAGLAGADLTPGLVPARCTPEGLLLIGDPPAGFGTYALPGDNYHVYDYALFWANIRDDAARRLAAFSVPRRKPGSMTSVDSGPGLSGTHQSVTLMGPPPGNR